MAAQNEWVIGPERYQKYYYNITHLKGFFKRTVPHKPKFAPLISSFILVREIDNWPSQISHVYIASWSLLKQYLKKEQTSF